MSSKCSHAIFHRCCPSCVTEWIVENGDKKFPDSGPMEKAAEGGLARMARAIDDLEKERDMWKFKATIYKHKLEQIHQLTDTNIAGLNGIKTKKQIEDEKFVEGESWGKEEVNGKKTS